MNLNSSRTSTTRFTACARLCIAVAFSSFSALPICRADDWSNLDSLTLQSIEDLLFQANLIAVNGITNRLEYIDQTLEQWRQQWQDDFWLGPISTSTSRYNWQEYLAAQTYLLGGVDGLSSSDRTRATAALQSIGLNYGKALTNSIPYYLREILKATKGSEDILAGNPWWSTNSSFALFWQDWNITGVPFPEGGLRGRGWSFPEMFSAFMSSLTDNSALSERSRWFDAWGFDYGENRYNVGYTWFDMVADWFKSNNVLATTTGTNEMLASTSESTDAVYDSSEPLLTNAVEALQIHKPNVRDFSDVLETPVNDIEDWLPDISGGDPRVVLFSGGTYGDVTVDRIYADFSLDSTTAAVIRRVTTWLWRFLLFIGLIGIARVEYDYWITLGGSAGA